MTVKYRDMTSEEYLDDLIRRVSPSDEILPGELVWVDDYLCLKKVATELKELQTELRNKEGVK
jgi:hypothetical protein